MIPVFQDSVLRPENEDALPGHLSTLLSFDGVHLPDQRNIHVHPAIAGVARLVQKTMGHAWHRWAAAAAGNCCRFIRRPARAIIARNLLLPPDQAVPARPAGAL